MAMMGIRLRHAVRTAPLLAALVAMPLAAGAQGVSLKVMPASSTVAPGSTFDMELQVTPAGSPFNAFDVVVVYDTTALTFVPMAPSTQQIGCLMTGACSAACGTYFHQFRASRDSLYATVSLLCNSIALTGPGQVYRLRFAASDSAQVTHVRIHSGQFYNAGIFVSPLTTADADIGIGVQLDAPRGVAAAWRLDARPNPARGVVTLAIEAPAAGPQRLAVFDVSGRLVRRLGDGWEPAGPRRLGWDGTDDGGMRVRPGLYLVRLDAGGRTMRTRVAVLD